MSVTRDKNTGKWMSQIRVKDWTGKEIHKKKRGFKTKKEALQWEQDFISQADGSLGMKFKDFVALYIKDADPRLRETTLANKRYLFNKKVLPYFGEMPINAIKPTMLSALCLMLYRGSELLDQFERGEFEPLPPQGLMEELYSILAAVELPEDHPCIFRSNHVSNYVQLAGTLPKDKERLLGEIAWSASELGKIKDWDVYNNTRY